MHRNYHKGKITNQTIRKTKNNKSKCDNKNNCGFIPNYPKLTFEKDSRVPSNGWYELEEATTVLNTLL